MKFTQLNPATFEQLQLNVGCILPTFDPADGNIEKATILGATTGGLTFTDIPSYMDWGEDIDNCPKNTMELKRIDSREVKLAGTFVSANKDVFKKLIGSADEVLEKVGKATKINIRDVLKDTDFTDLWWVGDYSNENGAKNGGFIAVKIKNALNTSGLSIVTQDKNKGQFAFEFAGHYTLQNIDEVPYELYVQEGSPEVLSASTKTSEKTVNH